MGSRTSLWNNGEYGHLNAVLLSLHLIDHPVQWLTDGTRAFWGALFARLWTAFPFTTFAFLAALQAIPADLYEAALIDGTTRRQKFWYITLPDDIVSVGVVGAIDYLVQGRKEDTQAIFEQELARCAPMQERLQDAEQLMPVKTTKDFSYRASRMTGEGWVLVGDAFCFLDPMYSSGVYLALKSGEMAADAIIDAINKEDFSAEQLGGFGPEFLRGTEAVRKMVSAFYSKDFNFGEFLKRYPDCKQGVIDVLSGNLFSEHVEPIFGPMGEMCELPNDITLTG